ncbi:MAG: metallophosphoesterase family protein [Sporichthyaceae bacterium]
MRLAVAGDIGTADAQEQATADAMAREGGPAGWGGLLLLGDNIYEDGNPDKMGPAVLQPFSAVLRGGTPLLAALGNHDVASGYGPAQLTALGQPGAWFTRQIGPVKVVVLDSNRPRDPDQLAFLKEALDDSEARWTVVAMHHPMFSAGEHGSSRDVRNAFAPLLRRHRVPLVLAGHDHDYQRSRIIDGTTYVVSGAAAKLRPTGRNDDTVVSASVRHFLEIEAYPDRLIVRAVDQQGKAFDSATIC